MYTVEKYKNDDGQTMAKITLVSNTLPGVSIDTYQSFTGESWLDSEYEYLNEETGVKLDWSNSDVKYNHEGILRGLAEASIGGIMDQLYDDYIESIEFVSAWSPAYYNFESDKYEAEFTVNWTKLKKWYKKSGKNREEWMRETWHSYDGFHSYMYPGYWENPEYHEGMVVYATIAMYLEETLDREQLLMAVAEAEWEVYQENSEIYISETDYEKMMAAHIAETVGEEFDPDEHLPLLMEARHKDIEVYMEKYPLNPITAANDLMEKSDVYPMPGQLEIL